MGLELVLFDAQVNRISMEFIGFVLCITFNFHQSLFIVVRI